MAAYAATVVLDHPIVEKFGTGFGLLMGRVDITNYNQTLAEITAITGRFKTIYRVYGGLTDNGYLAKWDATGKSFKVYATGASSGAALAQLASDTDAGELNFLAIGVLP